MNLFEPSLPLKMLVVEDNPGDYFLLKEVIGLSGLPIADIQLAETVAAAVDYLRENQPDVIFLDLYLPDSNGLESFAHLQEYFSSSAVIILSGLSDTRLALEAISLGAQDYLIKGEFDKKLLEKTVTYAIERRRNLERLRSANERYRLVRKATNDLIWDWDLVTGEIYRDETAVKQVYGVASNQEIRHIEDWNRRLHPKDREQVLAAIEAVKHSAVNDSFEFEYRFLGDNNLYRVIHDRGYIVRDKEGKPIRLIGAAKDITEKRRMQKELDAARRQNQRAVTEATIEGQEKEREQLGKELHDNINQILATSRLFLDHALSEPDVRTDMIKRSREFIILAIQEIRKLSHALLPPELQEFGLLLALDKLAQTIGEAGKFNITKGWLAFDESVLQKDHRLTIYRIVQEQLNNIIKHAGASNVHISLDMAANGKEVVLSIMDDGRGFDPGVQRNGVGLRNIASRAELFDGQLYIRAAAGEGCELKVVFPLARPGCHQRTADDIDIQNPSLA